MIRRVAAGALVWVLFSAGLARADDGGGTIDAIINHGVELRRQGKDREALAEFQRAAQISRTPRVVGQIGLAEIAVGVWLAAEEDIREALKHPDDPWIRKNAAILEKSLAITAAHLGTVEVWGSPVGAEVLIDGRTIGKLPVERPARVVAGQIVVTVRARGYQSVVRPLQVVSDQLTRENVELSLAAPLEAVSLQTRQPGAEPPAALVLVTPTGDRGPNVSAPPGDSTADHPLYKRWWFWTLVGGVVATGAIATVAVVSGRDQTPGCPAGVTCPSR